MNCVSTNMKMFISKREIHICTCSSSFLSKRQSCSRETSSLLLPATSVSLLNLTAAQAPSTCKTPTVACVYQVYSYNNVHVSIKFVHTIMHMCLLSLYTPTCTDIHVHLILCCPTHLELSTSRLPFFGFHFQYGFIRVLYLLKWPKYFMYIFFYFCQLFIFSLASAVDCFSVHDNQPFLLYVHN